MLDELGIAMIDESPRKPGDDPRAGLGLPQQQATGIRCDRLAIKPRDDPMLETRTTRLATHATRTDTRSAQDRLRSGVKFQFSTELTPAEAPCLLAV